MTAKSFDPEADDAEQRVRMILGDEFDLAAEVARLRAANRPELAHSMQQLIASLVVTPPRWLDAERFALLVADECYGSGIDLNYFRDEVMHALLPLLYDLPETPSEMDLALRDMGSKGARALGAARIVRTFPCGF